MYEQISSLNVENGFYYCNCLSLLFVNQLHTIFIVDKFCSEKYKSWIICRFYIPIKTLNSFETDTVLAQPNPKPQTAHPSLRQTHKSKLTPHSSRISQPTTTKFYSKQEHQSRQRNWTDQNKYESNPEAFDSIFPMFDSGDWNLSSLFSTSSASQSHNMLGRFT